MTDRSRSDYPAKIADGLEQIATRIRSLTVDRVAVGVTWAAIGVVIATLAVMAVFHACGLAFRAGADDEQAEDEGEES